MKILSALLTLLLLPTTFAGFHEEAGKQWAAAEAAGNNVIEGSDGYLFWAPEFRYMSFAQTHGDAARQAGKAAREELRDPLPAITDFRDKLKEKGVELLVVPVPPKAWILHEEAGLPKPPADTGFAGMIQALKTAGVETLDLAPLLEQADQPYCRTDTHWSPEACEVTAKAIAEWIKNKGVVEKSELNHFSTEETLTITGDLVEHLPTGGDRKETLPFIRISGADGNPLPTEFPDTPVVLLGDSHTLVFHDPTLLASGGGLADHLAAHMMRPIEVRGTRGSGATAVRMNLVRHVILQARKGTDYWEGKQVVVWVFTARDFTEATDGWKPLPIAR